MASCNILLHKIETPGWVGFDLVWLGLVWLGEREEKLGWLLRVVNVKIDV